jgi:hypothetical protein
MANPNGPSPRPSLAVVLVLSKEFVSSPYPTAALHLLLERHNLAPKATLLPIACGISWEDLLKAASDECVAAARGDWDQPDLAQDLKQLQEVAPTEVRTVHPPST